jgi:hypothetical protein
VSDIELQHPEGVQVTIHLPAHMEVVAETMHALAQVGYELPAAEGASSVTINFDVSGENADLAITFLTRLSPDTQIHVLRDLGVWPEGEPRGMHEHLDACTEAISALREAGRLDEFASAVADAPKTDATSRKPDPDHASGTIDRLVDEHRSSREEVETDGR